MRYREAGEIEHPVIEYGPVHRASNFRFLQTVSHVTTLAKNFKTLPVSSSRIHEMPLKSNFYDHELRGVTPCIADGSSLLIDYGGIRRAKITLPALQERMQSSETTAVEPQQTRAENLPCLHV